MQRDMVGMPRDSAFCYGLRCFRLSVTAVWNKLQPAVKDKKTIIVIIIIIIIVIIENF